MTCYVCSCGLWVLWEAPKTFNRDHTLGDPAQHNLKWHSSAVEHVGSGISSGTEILTLTVNILTLSEPHFCCLLNGGTPRNYPKKDVWRIKEHKYIRKVLSTVSGAWYTLSTC